MNLTPEEAAIAKARGCRLIAADAQQVAVLSMQRRVFWIQGEPWLIMREDGFFETAATLRHLLEQPGPVAVPAPEAPAAPAAPAPAAADATASDIAASEPPAAEPPAAEPLPAAVPAGMAAAQEPAEMPADAGAPEAEDTPPLPSPPLPFPSLAFPPLPVPPDLPVAGGILALGAQDAPPRTIPAALVITANIVSRYVAATPVDTKDLPDLIRSIHRSVCALQPSKEGA